MAERRNASMATDSSLPCRLLSDCCLLLEIFVEPAEEGALPEDAVLRLQHPMVFIREKQHLCVYSSHACSREGAFGLCVFDSEIFLTVDAQNGGVPFVNIKMRRGGIGFLHFAGGCFFPRG